MSISFEQLVGYFSKKAVRVHRNKEYKAIYNDAKLITKSQKRFEPGFIYVGNGAMLPDHADNVENASFMLINDSELAVQACVEKNPNMIEFQAGEDVFEICNQTRGSFWKKPKQSRLRRSCLKRLLLEKDLIILPGKQQMF